MKAHVIEIAALHRLCSPRGPQACTLACGDYVYQDLEIFPTQMGGGFSLEIHREPCDPEVCHQETQTPDDFEPVSLLQSQLQEQFHRLSQMLQSQAYHNWLLACSLEDDCPADSASSALTAPTEPTSDQLTDLTSWLQISLFRPVAHRLEDDAAETVRQYVAHTERQAAAAREALLWQQPPVVRELFDLLQLAAARDPFHQGHHGILTWYLSHAHSRRCNLPRFVPLEDHPATWGQNILHMWRDQIYYDSEVAFYVVFPEPYELEQAVAAHLLVVQHENDDDVAALLTLYDNAVFGGQATRFAFSSPRIVTHQILVHEADRTVVCQWPDVQCQSWHGWDSLNHHPFVQAQNGYGFTLSVQRHLPRQVLSLQDLLPLEDDLGENNPATGIVWLTAGHFIAGFPKYLEVSLPYNSSLIRQELACWGFHCKVFLFGDHDKALCFDEHYEPPSGCWHYMYVNQDTADGEGTFLHSSPSELSELDHMQFLLLRGYPKAVIFHVIELMDFLFRVDFHFQEGIVDKPTPRVKRPKPWPQQCTAERPQREPVTLLADLPSTRPTCLLSSAFSVHDLEELLTSSQGILCEFFEDPKLADICRDAFRFCAPDPHAPCDRWLIYTDGSSAGPNRHAIPDQPGNPEALVDAWAFLVVGETYVPPPGAPRFTLVGWSAQPIHYDENLSHFLGADRLGADVAEREGLFWAALWRLGQNSSMPTVFRPDSLTTGHQAFGIAGAQQHNLSFRALRGIFQALQSLLPGDLLRLEHVVSRTDDPFNAFVDHAAKEERGRSYFLPRQPVDMVKLRPLLPFLWMYLDRQSGLPRLTQHGFDAHAPELPVQESSEGLDSLDHPAHHPSAPLAQFAVSMASANVASLCHRPEGHSGRLDYLRQQFKAHGLHFAGIQEARTEACSSTVDSVYRIAAGHSQGHYGVELWVNLAQPFIWMDAQPFYLAASNFVAIHLDPRCLIVRLDHAHLQAFLVVAHAPQSGQPADVRAAWWSDFQDLLSRYCRQHPCCVMIDANSTSGPSDGIHVFQNDDASSANTEFLRDLLCHHDLCLPSTDSLHEGTQDTWTSPDGSYAKRIDYVAIPVQWHSRCSFSQVLEHFDFAKLYDHSAVGLELRWQEALVDCTGTRKPASSVRYHRSDIRTTDLHHVVSQQPVPSWSVNIEDHVAKHQHQSLQILAECCPPRKTQLKKVYLTPEIWHLRTAKLRSKKLVRAANRQCKQHLLRFCFGSWRASRSSSSSSSSVDLMDPTVLCHRLRATAASIVLDKTLRHKIAAAKRLSLQQALGALDTRATSQAALWSYQSEEAWPATGSHPG